MEKVKVFLQWEGHKDVVIVEVPENGSVKDLISAAIENGMPEGDGKQLPVVYLENSEESLNPEVSMEEAGIGPRQHVHMHRNQKIQVTATFNGLQKSREFAPSTTVGKVKKWAAKEFGMSKEDAVEHVLKISGSTDKPDEYMHIGALVLFPENQLFFDLVPKIRVEG
jgi:hypothetical protein